MTFKEKFEEYLEKVNRELDTFFACRELPEKRVYDAVRYSLSAGGPIVEPEASGILVTPICAHDIVSRCIVASDKRIITIGLSPSARRNAFLSVDGGRALKMNIGDVATIKKSNLVTKLVRLKDRSFYDVVNMKFKNT